MQDFKSISEFKNVAFISTRIAGTDGVSLEIEKWAEIFEQEGFTCFYFAGELDRPAERCYLVPEAHFNHPDIKDVYLESFAGKGRHRQISKKMYQLAIKLKDRLYEFVEKFDIQIIIPENALTIYFRKPIVVNAYSIYTKDIKPKGFSVIEIDGYVTSQAVEKAGQILDNPDLCQAMVDHNYELGKKFFSYAVLHQGLRNFMRECGWLPGEFG